MGLQGPSSGLSTSRVKTSETPPYDWKHLLPPAVCMVYRSFPPSSNTKRGLALPFAECLEKEATKSASESEEGFWRVPCAVLYRAVPCSPAPQLPFSAPSAPKEAQVAALLGRPAIRVLSRQGLELLPHRRGVEPLGRDVTWRWRVRRGRNRLLVG